MGRRRLMCSDARGTGQHWIARSAPGFVLARAGGRSRRVGGASSAPCTGGVTTLSLHPRVSVKTQNRRDFWAARCCGDLVRRRCVRCTGFAKQRAWTTPVPLNPHFTQTLRYLTMQESWVWFYKQKYCGRWRDGARLSRLGCAVS